MASEEAKKAVEKHLPGWKVVEPKAPSPAGPRFLARQVQDVQALREKVFGVEEQRLIAELTEQFKSAHERLEAASPGAAKAEMERWAAEGQRSELLSLERGGRKQAVLVQGGKIIAIQG